VGLVVLGAVITGLAVWLLIQPSSPEQSLNRFVITPSSTAVLTNLGRREVVVSPDGRQFVYHARPNVGEPTRGGRLYLRSLDHFVDRPIPGAIDVGGSAFFSPDGESVGFFDRGSLKKISLAGRSPITLSAVLGGGSGSWFNDTIVFSATLDPGQGLYRISANGGEPEMLATANSDEGEQAYGFPEILPDGKNLLFSIRLNTGFQTSLLSLESGERKVLLENARQARYLSTGHLVYEQSRTGNLMAVPFDLTSLDVTGDSVPVVQGVRQDGFSVDYSVSDNGTLVYVPASVQQVRERSLVWVDRDGKETLVTKEKRDFIVPRISPDGKRMAIAVNAISSRYISIYDFEADSFSRLTFGEDESAGLAVWSSDSKWLIFQSRVPGSPNGLIKQPFDGSRPPERLTSTTGIQMPGSWSRDGQYVVFAVSGDRNPDIAFLPMEGEAKPQYIISSEARECCPRLSPDGRWLAYVSDELGRINVYVSPFPESDVKWLVSEEAEGGGQPVWSPDGKELFYRSVNRMMVVSVQARDQALNIGNPKVLFEGSYVSTPRPAGLQQYDISPDGQRFLMIKEGDLAEAQGQINVVLNWDEELKRRVPTN